MGYAGLKVAELARLLARHRSEAEPIEDDRWGDYCGVRLTDMRYRHGRALLAYEMVTRPQAINLMLYSYTHGTDYRYKDDHQVELLIDDKLIGSGLATLEFHAIDPRGGVTESYNIGMPFEVLAQILTAKSAKLKFGKTMFDLNAEAITALKDLQRAIE